MYFVIPPYDMNVMHFALNPLILPHLNAAIITSNAGKPTGDPKS